MTSQYWAIFFAQCFAVLVAPGPTNALLAGAGMLRGIKSSVVLIAAELCAYGLSIGLLIFVLGPVAEGNRVFDIALKATASILLMVSAIRIWRSSNLVDRTGHVGALQVFSITLINPKGLIFAFGIFPGPSVLRAEPLHVALFALAALFAALIWILAGAALARGTGLGSKPELLSRAMSLVIAMFAVVMAMSAAKGLLA